MTRIGNSSYLSVCSVPILSGYFICVNTFRQFSDLYLLFDHYKHNPVNNTNYTYVHTYTNVYTHTRTYVYIYTYVHTHIHTYLHVYTYIGTHIRTYKHIYTHATYICQTRQVTKSCADTMYCIHSYTHRFCTFVYETEQNGGNDTKQNVCWLW
jgi:hypothetical protein